MAEKASSAIDRFVALVMTGVRAQDRGLLADLRHGFSPGTEYRAWPHLAPFCDLARDRERVIWQTVAAGLATHESTSRCGNLGVSLRRLALTGSSGGGDEALKSFDSRFRRLLTCETAAEVCERLVPIIRAAKQKGIAIDFEKLFHDLLAWETPQGKVKIRWASTYWSGQPVTETEEDEEAQ